VESPLSVNPLAKLSLKVVGVRRILLCLLLSAGVVFGAAAQEQRFLRIGTGAAADTFFALGTLLASAISSPPGSRPCSEGGGCGVPGLIAVAQTSQGSFANLSAIGAKEIELGLAQADTADWAYRGIGLYHDKGAIQNLRAIAGLYQVTVQVVVRRDAGISQIAGLRGKRVSLGPADSGALLEAKAILDAYGLREADLQARLLPGDLAIDVLRDGKIDALFLFGVPPNDKLAELAEDGTVDVLPIDGPQAAALRAVNPVLREAVLAEGTYPGIPARRSLGIATVLVASADLDANLAYGITRALWHDTSRTLLARGLPRGTALRMEQALDGITVPFHPGAARFYQEAGIKGSSANQGAK
jgi:TRAP transporter TAXI family solute receptor